jgi:uncharacterized glyoxalase superfamily protein PhnB
MAKVRPVPKGYHTVTAGIALQGAAEFIKFCKKAFGATELMRMAGPNKSVMHAEILIGDTHIMCGDEMPGMGNKSAKTLGGTPVTLHVYVPDCDAVYKKAVKAGATAMMPLSDMFWGDRYGTLMDPFGNTWAVATHIEDVDAKEMKRRGAKMMKEMMAGAGA